MVFTDGEKCIVCGKSFTEEDDIVICPHCGTPHHRECYNQLGHCANNGKHGSGYAYNESASKDETEASVQQETQSSAYFYSPESSANTVLCSKCGAANPSDIAFCTECGERLDNSFASVKKSVSPFGVAYNQFEGSSEVIDGKSVSDISAVVGTNAKRFVDKFRSGKKASWNWGAFLFNGYYFMFRKMYKEGAVVIALKLAVTLVVQGAYAKNISDYMNILSSIAASLKDGGDAAAALSNELISQMTQSYMQLVPMVVIMAVSSLVIAVLCGLFADAFYKKKVFSVLDKVEANLANGGSFGVNPIFGSGEELSQKQMRELYLNKLGGISIFAPIFAYLVLEIIISFVIPML